MSFILDALKKSENERQRQAGPSLADVRMGRRRAERPWWAVGVAALLVINLGVLLALLIRDGSAKPNPPEPQATPAPIPQAPTYPGGTYTAPPPQSYQYQQQYQSEQQPPAPEPQRRFSSDPSVRSLADEAGGDQNQYPQDEYSGNAGGTSRGPAGASMTRQIQPPSVAPLPGRTTFGSPTAPGAANDSNNETFPTANDLSANGTNLPELHLDIHVHSKNPSERFVFVNMRKYLEGETLKEGPIVERITSDGVVLNQRGLRFLLPRQ